ncbi:MAG: FkbM family methyltransferase [Bacteroidales bacterium]
MVQIGANDGYTGDPFYYQVMRNKNWKVVFVEPVPYLFEKLQNNYPSNPRFRFENTAINDGSRQVFYFVPETAAIEHNLPKGYDQMGSFVKGILTESFNGILTPYIQEIEISGKTLNQLFTEYAINNLKLLLIDAEGYDWKILSQLDLSVQKPVVINFEHYHLQDSEKTEAISFLNNDYLIFEFGADYLCIRKENFKQRDLNKLKGRIKNRY